MDLLVKVAFIDILHQLVTKLQGFLFIPKSKLDKDNIDSNGQQFSLDVLIKSGGVSLNAGGTFPHVLFNF